MFFIGLDSTKKRTAALPGILYATRVSLNQDQGESALVIVF